MPKVSIAVRATGLEVRYGRTSGLGRSDFEIPSGGLVAIIGPNGSGKSTLLHTIAGLVPPTRGSIEVFAERHRISYVMQATKVNENLPVTVREVVAMGRYATLGGFGRMGVVDRAAINEAIDRMQIADITARHLHDLSDGQRQRVFMAQGLAQDHDILLLDEPLTGIDLVAAQAIDDVIHAEIDDGCTVIMTTHDLSEARLADYVLLLSGRVLEAGSADETLTEENLMRAYGPLRLHGDPGHLHLDDPAHAPVVGRHAHRERSIHTESDRAGMHGDREFD